MPSSFVVNGETSALESSKRAGEGRAHAIEPECRADIRSGFPGASRRHQCDEGRLDGRPSWCGAGSNQPPCEFIGFLEASPVPLTFLAAFVSPDEFVCMILGSFLPKSNSGSFSPWWHVTQVSAVTLCAAVENESCSVPMPWQFSHWTFESCGVEFPLTNPPGFW